MTSENVEQENLVAGGKIMSLFDHLSELRARLVRSISAITLLFFACLFYATPIINFLKKTVTKPKVDFATAHIPLFLRI